MRHIKMCFPEYLVGGVYLHCPVMSYCQNCCVIMQNELNEAQPCFFLVIGIDLQSLVIERNEHTYQCKPREMLFEKFRRYIYINQRYLRLLNVRFFALPPCIFGLIDEWFILRALSPPPFDQVQSLSTRYAPGIYMSTVVTNCQCLAMQLQSLHEKESQKS